MKVEQISGADILLLDIKKQHLSLDIPKSIGFGNSPTPKVPVQQSDLFISSAVLSTKAKQFDDGLYAATELIVQNGAGQLRSKRELINIISGQLLQLNEPLLKGSLNTLAASRLGGEKLDLTSELNETVSALENDFFNDGKRSKPISFYTWSPELIQIFQHDRILQGKFSATEYKQVISIIKDQSLSNDYLSYLAFVSKLTNPVVNAGLSMYLSSPETEGLSNSEEFSMLPPSVSAEGELVKKLYGNKPIPEGFDLMQEVIDRIRSGQIDFTPTKVSGWYDHQLWSFEPLVIPDKMPESSRMTVQPRYKEKLEEMFKGLYALARETHAKQLEMPLAAGCAMPFQNRRKVVVSPKCTIELLPTHYLRRAKAYKFIQSVLVEHLGEECLKRAARLTENGRGQFNLFDELSGMIKLFYGAYCQASLELGMPAEVFEPALDQSECLRLLNNWYCEAAVNDLDLGRDMRMMVPVFYDMERKLIKVWLFMGWSTSKLEISFRERPVLLAVNGEVPNSKEYDITYASTYKQAAYPEFREVYVDRLLDRDEFRAHCDQYGTVERIIAHLPGAQSASVAESR